MEKRSWIRDNAAVILSTLTILAAVAGAYGEMRANVQALTQRVDRVQASIEEHRSKGEIHVDVGFRDEVRGQLSEIRGLLLNHMEATQRK